MVKIKDISLKSHLSYENRTVRIFFKLYVALQQKYKGIVKILKRLNSVFVFSTCFAVCPEENQILKPDTELQKLYKKLFIYFGQVDMPFKLFEAVNRLVPKNCE